MKQPPHVKNEAGRWQIIAICVKEFKRNAIQFRAALCLTLSILESVGIEHMTLNLKDRKIRPCKQYFSIEWSRLVETDIRSRIQAKGQSI